MHIMKFDGLSKTSSYAFLFGKKALLRERFIRGYMKERNKECIDVYFHCNNGKLNSVILKRFNFFYLYDNIMCYSLGQPFNIFY